MIDHFGSALLARADGARAREVVRELQLGAGRVHVDFSGVEVMTPGFADEFFARLPTELFDSGRITVNALPPDFQLLQRLVTRRPAVDSPAPVA